MTKKNYYPVVNTGGEIHPFASVEELWFWFINANQAQIDGAKYTAGLGAYNRPCQPSDILVVIDRLRRNRRLLWDHIKVLRCYGRRQLSPDPYHPKEARAATLWQEAMKIMETPMIDKGFIEQKTIWPEIAALEMSEEGQPIVFSMTSANDTQFSEFQK